MRNTNKQRSSYLHGEPLESRMLLDGEPIISEFMAVNSATLADEDGDYPDWIELHNPSSTPLDLNGWYLTDDSDDLTKWRLPALTVPPLGFEVIFASDKNRSDPAARLHANFKLQGGGEYLALVQPDGTTIAHEFSPEFPEQLQDVSYGAVSAVTETKLIARGARASALVPQDGSLGSEWTTVQFDDSAWSEGLTGVGYDLAGETAAEIGLDIADQMSGINASAFIRVPFQVDSADQLLADQVTLAMQYDDGFVAHLNGQQIISRNAPGGGTSPGSGLVAYYSFDDVLHDQAGEYTNNSGDTDNHLTAAGGADTRFVTGQVGNAVALNAQDGDNLRLTSEAHADLDLGGEFTIEAWIYPHELSGWGRLVMEWDGSGKNSLHFALRNGSQLSAFHVDDARVQQNVDSPSSTVGLGDDVGWQHVAVTGDGENLRLYHNGVEVSAGSRGTDDVPTPTPYSGTTWPLVAGLGLGDSAGTPSSSNAFNGLLDEVALWNVALSGEEINSHFVAGGAGYGLIPLGGANTVSWNSSAVSERPEQDEGTIPFDEFDISEYRDLLRMGQNVLAIQGLNASSDNDDFLITPELSVGNFELQSDSFGYFDQATPRAANSESFFGLLSDIEFSQERGFVDAPFDLEIGSQNPKVTIRYTLDGSWPTETTGAVYTGPITIAATSTVRAAAFRDGFRPSEATTHTYLFVNDVLTQPNVAPRGAHWDTAMDPEVVNDADQTYSVAEGLLSIPALSIVMDDADLFGARGIYRNATQRGDDWERPGSVEFFYPDEYQGYRVDDGFAINAGVKINGGASRNDHNPKHSFRLNFRAKYGESKLAFPLFESSPVDEFDTLMVRTGHNQGWFTGQASSQYLRERYADEVQLALGQPSAHGTPVHVYLNGLYWGLYNFQERPDDSFGAAYFGGEKEEYDVIKGAISPSETRARLSQGNRDAWDAMFAIADRDMTDPQNYAAMQAYLDIDNLIDYVLSNQITGEQDAPT